jgi:hypothetical protein
MHCDYWYFGVVYDSTAAMQHYPGIGGEPLELELGIVIMGPLSCGAIAPAGSSR